MQINIIPFIQKNYLGLIAVAILAYVAYKVYNMLSEKNEPGEMGANTANTNYAPVPYNTVKTKNFDIDELTCKDGTKVPAVYTGNAMRLLTNLQVLRDAFGLPVHINSGYRTPSHNAKQPGAATNSAHLKAMAADIVVIGKTPAQVHAKIKELIAAGKMQLGGLSLYPSFVHYDVANPRTW